MSLLSQISTTIGSYQDCSRRCLASARVFRRAGFDRDRQPTPPGLAWAMN